MSSRQHTLPMLVECADLAQAQAAWERLISQNPVPDVAASFLGFRLWVSHFHGAKPLPLLTLQMNGTIAALLPAVRSCRSIAGVNLRLLHAPGNPYWRPTYPILGHRPELTSGALLASLLERRDWDLLEIGPVLSSCPVVQLLLAHGRQFNMMAGICGQYDDPVVRLSGSWEDYHATLSRRVRAQIRHGEVRLAREGPVEFEEYRGGPDLLQRMQEFFRVEAGGWKARQGSAIINDPVTQAFYTELAQAAAAHGWLRLYFLRVAGRCVAANYCLAYHDTLHMLKVGYDEALAHGSPGHVLRKRLIQHLFADGQIRNLDMMIGGGDHQAYKSRWANHIRQYVLLRLFNPRTRRGRLACRLSRIRQWLHGCELEGSMPAVHQPSRAASHDKPISSSSASIPH